MHPYQPSPPSRTGEMDKKKEALRPMGSEDMLKVFAEVLESAPSASAGGLAARRRRAPPRLEVWTDRLREWFSARLLRPLHRLLDESPLQVTRSLRALSDLNPQYAAFRTIPEVAVLVGTTTQGKKMLTDYRAFVCSRIDALNSVAFAQAISPERIALENAKSALDRHLYLLRLLAGKAPEGLVASIPPGYMRQRIRQLAEGTVLADFRWRSGSQWQERMWSTELPDDSQVMLYLFCAYLESAAFVMPPPEEAAAANADAEDRRLYLASLPQRALERYLAVLSAPPPATHAGATALVMSRDMPPFFAVHTPEKFPPNISRRSVRAAIFQGPNAVFHAILLLLLIVDTHHNSVLGRVRLASPQVALADIFAEGWQL